LIRAVDRFEPDREIDFLSFAVPTTTGEVPRFLRDRCPAADADDRRLGVPRALGSGECLPARIGRDTALIG
jgi:hypothetical protein